MERSDHDGSPRATGSLHGLSHHAAGRVSHPRPGDRALADDLGVFPGRRRRTFAAQRCADPADRGPALAAVAGMRTSPRISRSRGSRLSCRRERTSGATSPRNTGAAAGRTRTKRGTANGSNTATTASPSASNGAELDRQGAPLLYQNSSSFVELGYVFNRAVNLDVPAAAFEPTAAWMFRFGYVW